LSLLEVEDLEAGYGPVTVVRGVSFAVEEGQVVTILGANGAGKTTTLRALSGVVTTRGRVNFDGRELSGRSPEARVRRGIAHVPEGRGNFASLTVEENLRLGAYVRRDGAAVKEDVARCYGYFPRLEERRTTAAGNLSGGEQQMLAVARGLMLRPRLLLLDEPSHGLSPLITREVFGILEAISHEEGTTLLIVEQNANLVLRFAHHAYVLETGRLVLDGTADDIASDEGVRRSYLGMV
jgi:branched-chain amino acid transport system ATP-binding protein